MRSSIIHISWIKHWLIDDLLEHRKDDIFLLWNDFWGLEESLNDDGKKVVLFHFIEKIDLEDLVRIQDFLLEKNMKFWLYVHTFFPFCAKWIYLKNGNKCDVLCLRECDCESFSVIWKFPFNSPLLRGIVRNKQGDSREFYDIFLKNLDFILVQDEFSYKLIEWFKEKSLYKYKIKLIRQFVDLSLVRWEKKEKKGFVFGFVGNTSEIKGFDFLFRFFMKYRVFFEDKKIFLKVFIHKDKEGKYKWIKFGVEKSDLKNIEIIYNEVNRRRIYSEMDCLIIPSIWNETGPMVLYEAFVNKIPVLVSDQESLKEKVMDRVDSYVFRTKDEMDLLKGVLWMRENYEKVVLSEKGFRYSEVGDFCGEFEGVLDLVF